MVAGKSGVHRLVRISPFDSSSRRHTSFSSVWVYPVVDDNFDIEINPSDLRIDTFRSSGPGGQHANKTDSAVRITHLPTGIVVTSSEKSQHQNRANCMSALKSRLYELEMRKRNESIQESHSQKGEAGWKPNKIIRSTPIPNGEGSEKRRRRVAIVRRFWTATWTLLCLRFYL